MSGRRHEEFGTDEQDLSRLREFMGWIRPLTTLSAGETGDVILSVVEAARSSPGTVVSHLVSPRRRGADRSHRAALRRRDERPFPARAWHR